MSAEPIRFDTDDNDRDRDNENDSRPEVYEEAGRVIIRASAIGGCIRNLVAARMGIRPVSFNEASLRRMGEGVIHEPHIINALTRDGWAVVDQQPLVELSIADGRIVIRGHCDAFLLGSTEVDGYVGEAKAMGRDVYAKWKRHGWAEFRRYAWQLSSYMHATKLPGVFAVKNRDTGEIDVTTWAEPPVSLAEVKLRAIKIAAASELPSCDPVMFPCQRYFLHESPYKIDPVTGLEIKGTRPDGLPPAPHEVPPEHVAAFDELARSYNEARDECSRAEAKRKEVGAHLTAFLENHALKKAVSSSWVVTDVERQDRRIDLKALRADLPDVAEKYTVLSTSRYPKVTSLEPSEPKEATDA